MESLPTELVELNLSSEVPTHYILDLLADWWLKGILVDPIEIRYLI